MIDCLIERYAGRRLMDMVLVGISSGPYRWHEASNYGQCYRRTVNRRTGLLMDASVFTAGLRPGVRTVIHPRLEGMG
jgi:hypothetical protein